MKLSPVVWLPHDTGTLTALKPCAFTASIIAFVVFGFPHDVSLERLFPPPIASRVFPKFQPVPMKLTSSVAVLPFISAADATCVTHIVIKAAIAKIATAVMTERVFFAVDIFSLLSW